jgi:hypothetical protein
MECAGLIGELIRHLPQAFVLIVHTYSYRGWERQF